VVDEGGPLVIVEFGHHTGAPYTFDGTWSSEDDAHDHVAHLTAEAHRVGRNTRYEVQPAVGSTDI